MNDTREDIRAASAMVERTKSASISAEALLSFLKSHSGDNVQFESVQLDSTPRVAGGSSGTVLFIADSVEKGGNKSTHSFVYRYDLGGTFFHQYDLALQYWIMKALGDVGFTVPKVRWLDAEGQISGHPGLVMDRIFAPAPTPTPLTNGPLMDAPPDVRHRMLLSVARKLGELHRIDTAMLDVPGLADRGSGAHFLDREISWMMAEGEHELGEKWQARSEQPFYAHQHDVILRVEKWLRENKPQNRDSELCHGDSNVTNFLFSGTDVAGVLDWELCHLGLGEADLAYMMCCIAHYAIECPGVEGIPTEQEFLKAYAETKGQVRDWNYARAFAQWRVAVISAIGFSRLPDDLKHLESKYWQAIEARLNFFVAGRI